MRLRAAWALPVAFEPIEDAEVVVEDGMIVEVRRRRADGASMDDALSFGEAVILPGFVNAHAHLEYTGLRGLLDDLPFFTWIRRLTDLKRLLKQPEAHPHCDDFWRASAILGAAEAVAGGTTTIADCTDSGAALDGLIAVGARGLIYQEVFGVEDPPSVETTIDAARQRVAMLADRADPSLHTIGVSPHSPYTVRPELLRALGEWARDAQLPMCIHAAESAAEVEFIRRGTGEIGDHLRARGITWMDTEAPRPRSSVAYLNQCGVLGSRTLLVHGINVSASDRRIVADAGASWVHCPRSNATLGNGPAPLRWMAACADPPRVGLGTDSAVSAGTLDMLEEMRFGLLLQRGVNRQGRAMIAARDILALATMGGARALGLSGRIGSLQPGLEADITVLGLHGPRYAPINDVTSAVIYRGTAHDILWTMVAGRIVYDAGTASAGAVETARKLAHAAVSDRLRILRGALAAGSDR